MSAEQPILLCPAVDFVHRSPLDVPHGVLMGSEGGLRGL